MKFLSRVIDFRSCTPESSIFAGLMTTFRTVLSISAVALAFTPFAMGSQTVSLHGDAGGKLFEGIGAVSGGGATSVLLKDYPDPQRSQVLDLLFKPKFGASMSALLVEVPGDGNSTQGSEPSHMHTRDDLNLYRGYEWWVMREAKKRNPHLTLDAVAWGAPGWIGNGNFWSKDMADYYVKWIQGLKSAHGLELDAIGCRNEKGVDLPFAKLFRATLNSAGLQHVRLHGFDNWGDQKFDWVGALSTDAELREAIDIISNHTMTEVPASAKVQRLAASLGKPLWNTEEHVYLKGFDCEIKLVQAFNENYVSNGVTKIVNWYLVASLYPLEPYGVDPAAMIANSPWSGSYRTREVLWGYAHYGQFSEVGWTYLNGGCGKLDGGGSFVTLKSPSSDYSVIVETNNAHEPQTVTFNIGGGLSTRPLCVWRSNAQEQFVQQTSITPPHGTFTITLDPKSIYSLSTTTGQTKGSFGEPPPERSFPLPYSETFDGYDTPRAFGYLPHYTADISGVFELSNRPDGKGGCLRQTVPLKPMSWAPEWLPYTIIGDSAWTDYAVSVDVQLTNDAGAGVMGRINDVGGGYGCTPKAYYLRVSPDGAYALIAIDGKAGPQDIGDKENQERLKAEAAAGKPRPSGEQGVATGMLPSFDRTKWHTLKLEFSGDTITGYIDGQKVVAVKDTHFSHGMAGLVACDRDNELSTAYYDNLKITPLGETKTPANIVSTKPASIYAE
jgi:galactosylceramidase